MIQYNELRFTPDGKFVIIDLELRNEEYLKDAYIADIVIDNHNTFVSAEFPSETPVWKLSDIDDDYYIKVKTTRDICEPILTQSGGEEVYVDGDANPSFYRIIIPVNKLGINTSGMLFVYVILDGEIHQEDLPCEYQTPCKDRKFIILQTIINWYPIYRLAMYYVKGIYNSCDIPKGFLDMILRIKAVELNIKTGHYTQAITFWKRFFETKYHDIVPDYRPNKPIDFKDYPHVAPPPHHHHHHHSARHRLLHNRDHHHHHHHHDDHHHGHHDHHDHDFKPIKPNHNCGCHGG